jgi:hypothetical protein
MALPRSRAIDQDSTLTLLRSQEMLPDEELTHLGGRRDPGVIYSSIDGRVLVPLLGRDGGGRLYESRDEYVAMMLAVLEEVKAGPRATWLQHGERLPAEVPELIVSLGNLLSLEAAPALNIDGVAEVEGALLRLPREQASSPEVELAVVAFVGEVIRIAVDGTWAQRLASDRVSREPEVLDRTGRPVRLSGLAKELLEIGGEGSIRGFAEHRIWRTSSATSPDESPG